MKSKKLWTSLYFVIQYRYNEIFKIKYSKIYGYEVAFHS